jgi:membrane fusion protein (multidrug efflux system)
MRQGEGNRHRRGFWDDRLKTVMALAALLTVSLGVTSCGKSPGSTASSAKPTPSQLEVSTVISQTLNTVARLPAELMPYQIVDIYARETGFVKSINVDRGSKVKQADLLVELDAPELVAQRAQAGAAYQSAQSQLAASQAKLAADRATYQRMSNAAKTPGVIAGNDLDIEQKTVQSGEAIVEALQKAADAAQEGLHAVEQRESYLTITAPFDGQITTRFVHPGALVGPAGGPGAMTALLRLETLTRLRLVVPVPESDAAGVPEGTQVSFTVPSFPGRTFNAPIARISHGVDVNTRTMPVELDVNDPLAQLVPGTFCEVEWPVHRTYPTLFVPVTSVGSDLERTFVVRVRQNKTEWVDVKTGVRTGNAIEVFGDLQAGDQVAIRGTDQLRPGIQVSSTLVTPP